MKSDLFVSKTEEKFKIMPTNPSDGVVELGLLLPADRAVALLQLARDRHESVGQVLRKLIESELARSA